MTPIDRSTHVQADIPAWKLPKPRDWVSERRALVDLRNRYNVPAIQGDADWRNNGRSTYRVRQSVELDSEHFLLGRKRPADFITILRRDAPAVILEKAEDWFGPVVDDDSYSRMRLETRVLH
jgi:hypothetical protein